MKTTLLTLAFAAVSLVATAQSQTVSPAPAAASTAATPDAYTAMMLATIAEQNAAKTPTAVQATLAKLERAAAAMPAAWEPPYYQARAYLKMGFAGPSSELQDKLFDQAQTALDQAKKAAGADQAEVFILQAYIYQGRIMAAPMTRGMVYSGRVAEALGSAKSLAPNNPRVYLLLANDAFYKPAMFGGGADKAKPLYEQAKALFATFRPATALAPTWGEGTADTMLAKLNGTATVGK